MSELEQLLGEALAQPVRPLGAGRDYVWPPAGYQPVNLPPLPSTGLKPQPDTQIPPHLAHRVGEALPPVAPRRLLDLPVIPGRRVEPRSEGPRPPRPDLETQRPGARLAVADEPFRQTANDWRARRVLVDDQGALVRLLRVLRAEPERTWTTDELAAAAGTVRYGARRTWQTLTRSEVCQALHPARDRGWVVMDRLDPDRRDLGVRWSGTLTEELLP
jgi:hypothetical protein